jgi:hypothetical protein
MLSLSSCFNSNKASKTNSLDQSNSPPVADNISPNSFNEDELSIISLPYSDAESDLAETCTTSDLENITIIQSCTCSAGVCSVGVISTTGYSGPAQFKFSVTTGTTTSNSGLVSLTINPVQDLPSTQNSTITASGPVIADGVSISTITITLKDQDSLPVVGETPNFVATDTLNTNIYGNCSTSNNSGISTCTLKSTKAETKTLSITSPISKTDQTVVFVAGSPSQLTSTIVATGRPVANGVDKGFVTITLKDTFANPIGGIIPTFSVSGSNNSLSLCSMTNSQGLSTCEVTSTKAENKTFGLISPVIVNGNSLDFNTTGINLQVPIDLIIAGLTSVTTDIIHLYSQTSLNTSDYVAQSNSYYFEVMAQNNHATNNYNISLVDSSDTELNDSVIMIPANTTIMKRFRVTWTPRNGLNTYRLKMYGTAASGNVTVHSAKIIVDQTKATSTKLYFPFMSHKADSHVSVSNIPIPMVGNGLSVNNLGRATSWTRNDSLYDSIPATDAWTFEAIGSAGAEASMIIPGLPPAWIMSLYNSSNQKISTSEITSTIREMKSITFNKDVTGFSNGETIQAHISTTYGTGYIHKAGLWLKLNFLKKAEVYNRVGSRLTSTVSTLLPDYRFLWEASSWSNPKVYFRPYAIDTTTSVSLIDVGQSDSSTVGNAVTNGTVTSLATYSGVTSPEINLINNNSYILQHNLTTTGTTQYLGGGFIIIQVTE